MRVAQKALRASMDHNTSESMRLFAEQQKSANDGSSLANMQNSMGIKVGRRATTNFEGLLHM